MAARVFWRAYKAGVANSLLALLTACTTLPAAKAPDTTRAALPAALTSAQPVVAPLAPAVPLASEEFLTDKPVFLAPAPDLPVASVELPAAEPVVLPPAPAAPDASVELPLEEPVDLPSAPTSLDASVELPAAEPIVLPPAPASPVASTAPRVSRASRFSDFISRHLLRRAEKPAPAPVTEATPVPETPVDEKYRFTGEDALEVERGQASWYGGQFHGRRTANGETYDKYALTAAHKTLPFGTIVRVRSLKLGREVDVRINDRGPFAPGRVIDVSEAAAEVLGLVGAGVAEVSLNMAGDPGLKIRKTLRKPQKSLPSRRR